MKIIQKSNFNLEHIDDKLIAENVLEYYAEFLTNALNEKYSGETALYYFTAVLNDYELYQFSP